MTLRKGQSLTPSHASPAQSRATLAIRAAALVAGLAVAILLTISSAHAGTGGTYAPITEVGTNFHTGKDDASITGVMEFNVTFRSEDRKGHFRPFGAFDLGFASGKVSLDSATYPGSVYRAAFLGGFHFFVFKDGTFQPFFGPALVVGWDILKMSGPPTGVDANTQALSKGYEITAGVDIRLGSPGGDALRLIGGMWAVSSGLANKSTFSMAGWRFGIGFYF